MSKPMSYYTDELCRIEKGMYRPDIAKDKCAKCVDELMHLEDLLFDAGDIEQYKKVRSIEQKFYNYYLWNFVYGKKEALA